MAAIKFEAVDCEPNSDWAFQTDGDGNVTALFLNGSVTYQQEGNSENFTRVERRDVWGALTAAQKKELQEVHDLGNQWFNNQFMGA